MSVMLCGIGVSRGIVMASAHLAQEIRPKVLKRQVPLSRREAEQTRFRKARDRTVRDLERITSRALQGLPQQIGAVLDSHMLMLRDPAFVSPVLELIEQHAYTAEWAVNQHRETLLEAFAQIEDDYLRERRVDVDDAITRLLRNLTRRRRPAPKPNQDKGYILVTSNIAPADLLLHQHDGMLGVVSERGGPLSHATIIARSLGIPAIAGVTSASTLLAEDDTLILDGSTGMVLAQPDERSLRVMRSTQRSQRRDRRRLKEVAEAPSITRDGVAAQLLANVEIAADLTEAKRVKAAGVGLFRTEPMYMNRDDLPSEQEHTNRYRTLLRKLPDAPVHIRTMDSWASPLTPALAGQVAASEQPALGLRGIRLCLRHPEIFKPQIRGLLRAAVHGQLRILLPMISSTAELAEALSIIEQCKRELAIEGRNYNPQVPVGLMVEVPATALGASAFARQVDFMSIGTNDLTQYTLAIDRSDETVQEFYDPLNPSVLRLIDLTIKACAKAEIPVSLCGEMAGDARYTRLLLGLGLTSFSMTPSNMLEVKQAIRGADISQIRARARRLLQSESTQHSARLLERLNGD